MIPAMVSSSQIPGLQAGCMPSDSIMESTLECFYDQACLSVLFNSSNLQPLNITVDSQFSVNTKIENLIAELFMEKWSTKENFPLFFQQCQPNRCTYSYNSRGNLAFVFTTILSLIGGLLAGLKIVATLIVQIYRVLANKFKKVRTSVVNYQGKLDQTAFLTNISFRFINVIRSRKDILQEDSRNDSHMDIEFQSVQKTI